MAGTIRVKTGNNNGRWLHLLIITLQHFNVLKRHFHDTMLRQGCHQDHVLWIFTDVCVSGEAKILFQHGKVLVVNILLEVNSRHLHLKKTFVVLASLCIRCTYRLPCWNLNGYVWICLILKLTDSIYQLNAAAESILLLSKRKCNRNVNYTINIK